MDEQARTNPELIEEISVLKQKIKELEHSESELKQAEEELRANRGQLPDIIDFLPDATLAIDKEGRVIIWNKAIEKMTGILAAEMIGKCDYAYTIPFYGEAQPQLMDLVFADSEEIAARYPNITREGYTLVAEVFCNALHSNKGAWVFARPRPCAISLATLSARSRASATSPGASRRRRRSGTLNSGYIVLSMVLRSRPLSSGKTTGSSIGKRHWKK
jgi:PAS domain S-box-containing protein